MWAAATGPRVLAGLLLLAMLPVLAPVAEAGTLYATNTLSGTASVIDTNKNALVDTIELGLSPGEIVALKRLKQAYVATALGVVVIDIDSESEAYNEVIATIPTEGIGAEAVVATSDETRVYVAAWDSVSVIDTSRGEVIAEVEVETAAIDLTIAPDDSRVFLSDYYGTEILVLENSTDPREIKIIDSFDISDVWPRHFEIHNIEVTPDGKYLYLTSTVDRYLLVVDPRSKRIRAAVPLRSSANELEFTPDGSTVYIGGIFPYEIIKLDTASYRVVSRTRPPALDFPTGIELSADGSTLYVGDYMGGTFLQDHDRGRVLVFDAISGQLEEKIEAGYGPQDLALVEQVADR